MSKEELNDLMMGAALVALGYALLQHFKQPAAALPAAGMPSPGGAAAAAGGPAFAAGEPSPFTTINDLLTGTVHDLGGYQGQNYLALTEAAPVNWWSAQ